MDVKGSGNKLIFFNKDFCKTILEFLLRNWIGKDNSSGYACIFKDVETEFHGIIYANILDRDIGKVILITNQNG